MNADINESLLSYCSGKLTNEQILAVLPDEYALRNTAIRNLFRHVIESKNSEALEYAFQLVRLVEKNNEFLDIIHQVILEPWHYSYEDIAHNLQRRRSESSIPFLREAMQRKYEYLESYGTGTRQFINQCGHALWSIGTPEAIEIITQLSSSSDPVLRDEMRYRISKINGTNNYSRDFDL